MLQQSIKLLHSRLENNIILFARGKFYSACFDFLLFFLRGATSKEKLNCIITDLLKTTLPSSNSHISKVKFAALANQLEFMNII